jgi:hypothetical protein
MGNYIVLMLEYFILFTLVSHARIETCHPPAILTILAPLRSHGTLLAQATSVCRVFRDALLEESFAIFARDYSEMDTA